MGPAKRVFSLFAGFVLLTSVVSAVMGFAANPAAAMDPIKIMPLGDSITEARTSSPGTPSYRSFLDDTLTAAGASFDFVGSRTGVLDTANQPDGMVTLAGTWDQDHEGHHGWRADELLNGKYAGHGMLSQWVVDHDPDVVLMHAGSNDIFQSQDNATTLTELSSIVSTLRAHNPNITVVISQLIGSTNGAWNTEINNLNAQIPGLVASLDTPASRVIMSDPSSGFNTGTMLYDQVHPSVLGQRHLADAFAEALLDSGLIANVPSTNTCPSLVVEGEDATITGSMAVSNVAAASGGQVVGAPAGSGNSNDPSQVLGTATLCVSAPSTGQYTVDMNMQSTSGSMNSLFFSVDASVLDIYDVSFGPGIVTDPLEGRNTADPIVLDLTAGDHTFSFWVRESGTAIDNLTLVPVGGGNANPVASFTSSCTDLDCTFDASGSSDDGSIVSYDWDFGDGSAAGTGVTPVHSFAAPGTYDVALTVTDDLGATDTTNVLTTVSISGPICGSTSTEAEAGVVNGTMTVNSHGGASGGLLVGSAQGSGDSLDGTTVLGSVEVCLTAPATADYTVDVDLLAPNANSNSFWFSVDSAPGEIFAMPANAAVITVPLNIAGVADPVELSLAAGDHTFVFWVREDGASLDRFTLNQLGVNADPTASFTDSCTDLDCTFDASGSSDDGSIVSYDWDFGDGSAAGTGVNPAHSYAAAGSYTVSLTVTDDLGATDTTTTSVTVTESATCSSTSAEFEDGIITGTMTTAADAAASGGVVVTSPNGSGNAYQGTPVRGSVEICLTAPTAADYTVDLGVIGPTGSSDSFWFSVDGGAAQLYAVERSSVVVTDELNESGVADPVIFPLTAGDHSFLFWVREDGASLDVATLVEVGGNPAPTASFTDSCTDLDCTFDASGSTDDGSIVSYDWDFGDGSAAGTGVTPAHSYAAAGTYTVSLTVTDDLGATDTATTSVTVPDNNNADPTASFTDSCIGLDCTFDASGSTDDGSIVSYDWDFGDGSAAGSGVTPAHSYAAAGTYTVSLTVTDDLGATDTTTTSVTVAVGPTCGSASAEFEDGIITGTMTAAPVGAASGGAVVTSPNGSGNAYQGTPVRGSVEICLTAPTTASYTVDLGVIGPTGSSDSFWFSVDGGAAQLYSVARSSNVISDELNESGVADPVILPLTAGDHSFLFWVREDGASLDVATLVEVGGNPAPTASFTDSCVGLDCTFDASGSSDDGSIVSYDWDFGDGSAAGTGVTPAHSYAAAGSYTVSLTVTDDLGATDTTTTSVTVAVGPTCGASVEAEDGIITGTMTAAPLANASGGAVVTSAQGSGNSNNGGVIRGSVEVCLAAPAAGDYTIDAGVIAPNGGSNSFWFRMDGGPMQLFSSPINTSLATDTLNNVGVADPVVFTLSAGNHSLFIWVREDGASIDNLTLVPVAP